MEYKLYVSKLADELLGDDLDRLAAQIVRELGEFIDEAKGNFLHVVEIDERHIYFITGTKDGEEVRCYIQRGYFHDAGTVPDNPKLPERMRGMTIRMPREVDHEDNEVFRQIGGSFSG